VIGDAIELIDGRLYVTDTQMDCTERQQRKFYWLATVLTGFNYISSDFDPAIFPVCGEKLWKSRHPNGFIYARLDPGTIRRLEVMILGNQKAQKIEVRNILPPKTKLPTHWNNSRCCWRKETKRGIVDCPPVFGEWRTIVVEET
jgi:hypothetical protein